MHRALALGLHVCLDLEQLGGIVKGHYIVGIVHPQGAYAEARLSSLVRLGQDSDHVREVLLALSVVPVEALQGVA